MDVKQCLKFNDNKRVRYLFLYISYFVSYVFGFLYFLTKLDFLPFIVGVLLLSNLFLFKGKNRFLSYVLFMPLTQFMTPKQLNIGSLLTWCTLIYLFAVIIEERKNIKQIVTNRTVQIYLVFTIFVFLITLLPSEYSNDNFFQKIKKFISLFGYWSLPICFLLDKKSDKPTSLSVYLFAISHLLINCFAVFFIYFTPMSKQFVSFYMPNYVTNFERYGTSFRYPGMQGDSNHDALYLLISQALLLINLCVKKRIKFYDVFLILSLLPFGLMGGSKTYAIGLIIIFVFTLLQFRKSRYFASIIIVVPLFVVLFLLIAIQFDSLAKVFLRFIYLDTRYGFIESLTTFRLSKWINYIQALLSKPLRLFIGYGVNPVKLNGFDYHNTFIQLMWEYGLLGSTLFILYMHNIIHISKGKEIVVYLPITIIIVFSFSLHILYDEGLYPALAIYSYLFYESKSVPSLAKRIREFLIGGTYYEIRI